MRPIERGAAPREYKDYRDAIGDLEARLGVWLTVFGAYPRVKLRLIDAFPGTPRACFDARGEPVARTALGI